MLEILEPPLGHGGFGTVYKAIADHEFRAIKVLSEDLQTDTEALLRFQRESLVLERIKHPGLIHAFGLVNTAFGLGLVMELADRSLMDVLHQRKQIPWTEIIERFPVLFEALHELHTAGVVHRDIKPQNILEVQGAFKIADLGIARLDHGWSQTSLTVSGFQPGTPTHLSPEQVRGQDDLDGRSDLYAMGVTLFTVLTGEYYLNQTRYKNDFELQLGILQDSPQRISANLNVPSSVLNILMRLLEKDRTNRPSTALEVADAFRQVGDSSLPIRIQPVLPIQKLAPVEDISGFVQHLQNAFPNRVKCVIKREAQDGTYGQLEFPLATPLVNALNQIGIQDLYSHQVAGMNAIRRKDHTIIVTGTASGKTLTYNLPIVERLRVNPDARALYLFPLKALANDQWYALQRLSEALGEPITAARYDGDTEQNMRREIEVNPPQALFANPDILHASILKNSARWAAFWRGLEFVVIDEVHMYVGAFGSHVANVIRRLQVIARQYGANPQFILASATIDDPLRHANELTGHNFTLVASDSAPRSERHFVFWEPFGSRLEHSEEWLENSEEIMTRLISAGYSAILFPPGRQQAERLANRIAERLSAAGLDRNLVTVYRGGLLAKERQILETSIKTGEIRGVVSTSALEVGVDIGSLDAVILAGFPSTMMSTWQRIGRAGRRGQPALVTLIARPNRFDLYHLEHPVAYLDRLTEPSTIYPDRDAIRDLHLSAATKEGSLTGPRDVPPWPRNVLPRLQASPSPKDRHPNPHATSLRGLNGRVRIFEGEHEIGEATRLQAIRELHPEALYSHAGRIYRVQELVRDTALVKREYTTHHTRPLGEIRINPHSCDTTRINGNFEIQQGALTVRRVTVGYREIDATGRSIKGLDLTSPVDAQLHTRGAWLKIPPQLVAELDEIGKSRTATPDEPSAAFSAIHAAEHLLGFALALETRCAPADISGIPQRHAPDDLRIYLWDVAPDGLELTQNLFHSTLQIVKRALDLSKCDCARFEGCPKCTMDSACELFNGQLWRLGGVHVLKSYYQALEKS